MTRSTKSITAVHFTFVFCAILAVADISRVAFASPPGAQSDAKQDNKQKTRPSGPKYSFGTDKLTKDQLEYTRNYLRQEIEKFDQFDWNTENFYAYLTQLDRLSETADFAEGIGDFRTAIDLRTRKVQALKKREFMEPELATATQELQESTDFERLDPSKRSQVELAKRLYRYADFLRATAQFPKGEESAARATRVLTEVVGNKLATLRCRFLQSQCQMLQRGKTDAAIEGYQSVMDERAKILGDIHPDVLENLSWMAMALLIPNSEQEKAFELADLSYRQLKQQFGEDDFRTAMPTEMKGQALIRLGGRYEAKVEFEKSLAALTTIKLDQSPRAIDCISMLGNVSLTIGDTKKAFLYCNKAIDVINSNPGLEMRYRVQVLTNLGRAYSSVNQHDKAIDELREAAQFAEKIYVSMPGVIARTKRELGLGLAKAGRLDEAYKTINEAFKLFESTKPKQNDEFSTYYNQLGTVLQRMGRLDAAIKMFESAVENTKTLENQERLPDDLMFLARAYNEKRSPEKAIKFSRDAYKLLHQSNTRTRMFNSGPEALASSQSIRNCMSDLLCLLPPEQTLESYRYVWKTKGVVNDSFSALVRQLRKLELQNPNNKWVQKFKLLQDQSAKLWRISEQEKPLAIERVERMETVLRSELHKQLDADQDPSEEIDPTKLAKLLPEDSAIVDFVRYRRIQSWKDGAADYEKHYAAFVLTAEKSKLDVKRIELGRAQEIDGAIRDWKARLTLSESDLVQRGSRPARKKSARSDAADVFLADKIWTQISKVLNNRRTIIVCPDGAIGSIPWALIPTASDKNKRLIEDGYQFVLCPRGKTVYQILTDSRVSTDTPGALIIADIDYGTPRPDHTSWGGLEGTKKDADSVSLLAGEQGFKVEEFRGRAATESQVKSLLPKSHHVLISTHSFSDRIGRNSETDDQSTVDLTGLEYSDRHPYSSVGIVLSGANQADDSNGADDNVLLAGEIIFLDLTQVDMAVLAACSTGQGRVLEGEGTFSLQKACHQAGVNSTLATLWPVDDQMSSEFVATYHEFLWQNNLSKTEALRQTQLQMIQQNIDVKFWGSWVLSGDWRKQNLTQKR